MSDLLAHTSSGNFECGAGKSCDWVICGQEQTLRMLDLFLLCILIIMLI